MDTMSSKNFDKRVTLMTNIYIKIKPRIKLKKRIR